MKEQLLSAGIDIGTTTTQLIFSRLTAENRAAPFAVPDVRITGKEVIYRSPVHFTPLLSDTVIDAEAIGQLLREEYRQAGVAPEQVQTGAVIITGETARKENAREVLRACAGLAGDFVVATAGPELESVLAGAGSGAQEYSREQGCSLLHFDIGGGTTNLALYEAGELRATGCLNVGGRLIKAAHGRISYISPVLEGLLPLQAGDAATEESLLPAARYLAGILELLLTEPEAIPPALRTTPLMKLPEHVDVLSFSGGVADLIYADDPPPPFLYGDLGVLLGRAIRDGPLLRRRHMIPRETIRATVVGAGSHSTQLSGSTIAYDGIRFPLQNLPVAALTREEQEDPAAAIGQWLRRFRDGGEDTAVIFLPGWKSPSFTRVQQLARQLTEAADKTAPLFVAVEEDMAKALGQAILAQRPGPLLCLDGVRLSPGSYLDIGQPIAGGSVLPVVIKTLIFQG